jgi:hypothetical protein
MSIRGVKTHIDVTLTSPLKRPKPHTGCLASELQSNSEGGSATPAAPTRPQRMSKDKSNCCQSKLWRILLLRNGEKSEGTDGQQRCADVSAAGEGRHGVEAS